MQAERQQRIVGALFAIALAGGAVLRVAHLGEHRFHVDEALFSSYGLLISSGLDPLLQSEPVDKPPLFFYVLALSFKVFGRSETAAAMPSLVASVGAIALVFYLCRSLYDGRTAVVAAVLMAISPFNVAYAYTAFIDPTMVAGALLAMVLAERCRFFPAGLCAGLLPALKAQGILFWPAIGLMGLLGLARERARPTRWATGLGLALVGLALPLLAVAHWSSLRTEQRPFLELAAEHNPLVVADPSTYTTRLVDWWLSSLQYLTGSPLANQVLLVGVPLLLVWDLVVLAIGRESRRAAAADWLLAAFGAFFVGWHTYYETPAWDRYMLGMVPIGLILAARAILLPWRALSLAAPAPAASPQAAWSLVAIVALFLGFSSLKPLEASLQASYPLGWAGLGGPTAYQGIEDVASYFKANVRPGALIFDYQSLSWHYKYYFFGLDYDLVWFDDNLIPDFQYRAVNDPKAAYAFIILPEWMDDVDTRSKLQGEKLRFHRVYEAYRQNGEVSFTVYRIEPAR